MKELVGLYSQARHGEYNLGEFLGQHPSLRERLGIFDMTRDDADLALQLAGTIGRYKRHMVRSKGRGAGRARGRRRGQAGRLGSPP